MARSRELQRGRTSAQALWWLSDGFLQGNGEDSYVQGVGLSGSPSALLAQGRARHQPTLLASRCRGAGARKVRERTLIHWQ